MHQKELPQVQHDNYYTHPTTEPAYHSRSSSTESIMSLTPPASDRLSKRKTPPSSPREESDKREKIMSTTSAPIEKKRTRTGCNICRERHLKCDEGKPHCSQCIKRKRTKDCNYGLQLKFTKFLDVRQPPVLCPVTGPYRLQDESMLIASEYVGGEEQYAALKQCQDLSEERNKLQRPWKQRPRMLGSGMTDQKNHGRAVDSPLQSSSSVQSRGNQYARWSSSEHGQQNSSASNSAMHDNISNKQLFSTSQEYRPIDDPLEQHFMEVFIEEIACWMDTMNAISYFSGNLPYESTTQPMLYNAFLACGAAHQSMVHPEQWSTSHHQNYWNKASSLLLQAQDSLKNGEASVDKDLLAKTSVVLAVYSTLVDGVDKRKESLSRGFDLVSDCGWRQTSINSEGACYWLLRGMELLTSLNFRVRDAVPEHLEDSNLGFRFDGKRETMFNMESLWARKIIGIATKIINTTRHDPTCPSEVLDLEQWTELSTLINGWHNSVPRTMLPLIRSAPRHHHSQPNTFLKQSSFPKIYHQNVASTFAAIIYHTSWLILLQYHPNPESIVQRHQLQMHKLDHARSICGIAKCVKSRPLASVILRPCLMAAEHLQDFDEQEEVLGMLEDFRRQTGWQIRHLIEKLHKVIWQRPDIGRSHSAMPLHQEGSMTASEFDNAMLQQLQMSQPLQNVQIQAYTAAPASQSILQSFFGSPYIEQISHSMPQNLPYQNGLQYMLPTDAIANTRSNRRSTITNNPSYTAVAYSAKADSGYPPFAPSTAPNQELVLQMTTSDGYPSSYIY